MRGRPRGDVLSIAGSAIRDAYANGLDALVLALPDGASPAERAELLQMAPILGLVLPERGSLDHPVIGSFGEDGWRLPPDAPAVYVADWRGLSAARVAQAFAHGTRMIAVRAGRSWIHLSLSALRGGAAPALPE